MDWSKNVKRKVDPNDHLKVNHRGTEDTEEVVLSLAGSPAFQRDRPLAREKNLRLRGKLFGLALTVEIKSPTYWIMAAEV